MPGENVAYPLENSEGIQAFDMFTYPSVSV